MVEIGAFLFYNLECVCLNTWITNVGPLWPLIRLKGES